ncbi:hypothetical protein H696_02712 [Fonticula alba]|uniref:PX domain-containing protein n=1 Tax=Fonticula alba TaxID=691883 RepID=A0A058Z8X3_FONAL|nr:hypothetical protein H696_02712 [Fonticula alba]KCV70378.1 hypothetical protein H696_02712 [Fonticula alba]|eukprot:XP_009494894.1 hypothetical protein H696_02712 [Fonticula alba]
MIVLADDLIDGGSHAHALGDGHGPGSPAHGGYYSDSEEELDEDDEICHLCSLPIRPQEPRVLVDEPATGPATGASTDSIDDDPLASPPLAPPHQQPSHSSMSLAAGGVYIHIHCMRCNVCAASLLEAPFSLDQNERVLCVGCSPKCHQCHQTILRDLVQAFGRTYHGDCFQCYQCHQPMKSSPQCSSSGLGGSNGTPGSSQHFYQQSGQPICSRCMSNRSVFIKRAFPEADELLHTTPPTPTDADPSMDEAPLTPTTAESDHFISLSDFQHGSVSKLPRSDSTLSVMTPRPSSTMVFNLANSRTLEGVLNSEQGTDYFVRFCIEDYSVEKIFFVLDLRQFETVQIASASDLHLYATTIFHKYLRPDAELAVDVPLDLRMDLFKVIESNRVSRSMFQRARALVYQQLEDEVFPKFFYSILGRRYLESIEFDDNGEVSLLSLAQRRKPAFSDIEAAVSMANLSASNQASGIPNTVVIVGASVRTFERRRDPDKYYAYEVVVHRAVCRQRPAPVDANSSQDQAIAITTIGVYRRFSQFFQLHQALTKQFPRLVFPPFPPRMKFGRSQVQRVTVQRLAHLDVYMKGLMQLAEVKTSARLLEFLHPSDDDIQNYRFNKRLSAISVDFTLKYH